MTKREDIDKIAKKLIEYPNVVGYAKTLQKRIRKGKIVDEWCIQVHVIRKVPEKELRKQDIIPKTIDGIPVDVVEYGEIRALGADLKKTDRVRPLVAGISIGNASITAGTLGYFMEKATPPYRGEVFLGSNAHVLVDDPKNEISVEKRILQPGNYDGGTEVVAEYYWHKRLYPMGGESTCNFAKVVASVLNSISKSLERKTRFVPIIEEVNRIDFAVARMVTDWEERFIDVDFPPEKYKFAGFGFGGSDIVSLICKQKYIVTEGYKPREYDVVEVYVGDILHKTGRSSCHTEAKVILESAYEIVNYGAYKVAFDDVIVTEKLLSPGDSGSAGWKEII